MKLKVEYKLTGPLSRPGVLHELEDAVERASSLEEAVCLIRALPDLETYRGGSHVAVHQRVNGALGAMRLAIVTEEKGAMQYHSHTCGKDNEIVNQCGCDPDNMPTRPREAGDDDGVVQKL